MIKPEVVDKWQYALETHKNTQRRVHACWRIMNHDEVGIVYETEDMGTLPMDGFNPAPDPHL